MMTSILWMTDTLTYITSPPFTKKRVTTSVQSTTIPVDTEDVLSLITSTEVNPNGAIPILTPIPIPSRLTLTPILTLTQLTQPTLRLNSKSTIDTLKATATMLTATVLTTNN